MNLKQAYSPQGKIETFPSPHGMSGSPVFLLHDGERVSQWGNFPITGILIEHRKRDQIVLATDIAVAIRLMDSFIEQPE